MSIFGSIMDKLFHPAKAAEASSASAAPDAGSASPSQAGGAPGGAQGGAGQAVDIGAVLSDMAGKKGGGGNYQTSIVDLLKLLDLDSSLDARKQLANELNVHAGADGSAEQNIALHKAVVAKLEQNGGKVPASMKS
ncbi:MAG: DUF3597 family protein [Acetobacteraceae bacterium]|nr:DUF3597 family protein [Acetobacteraceae bacterium]